MSQNALALDDDFLLSLSKIPIHTAFCLLRSQGFFGRLSWPSSDSFKGACEARECSPSTPFLGVCICTNITFVWTKRIGSQLMRY
ncbi:hypothetical protein SUGI_0285680 [Cryptomeria japonica]|nr:hypothetical protein SUGI_0285680 [Cryptomeria japonica]